jgi:ribosomal protein L11 methyltransferase
MNFIQVNFRIEPYQEYIADLLVEELGEIGFDSFVKNAEILEAFAPLDSFSEVQLKDVVMNFPFEAEINYTIENVPSKNWNEEWEKHFFEPIVIDNECVIHSSFHKDVPSAKYDIVIDPKMSFGTGHHETTSLMIAEILKMELSGKKLLDMGCGTSVLAILAAMRGAKELLAVDIDEWCVENSLENIELNKVQGIEVVQGGAEVLAGKAFDIILANINRNILLVDMQKYSECLSAGGELYMSGFYREDIPLIEAEANQLGLEMQYFNEKNKWVAVKTVKIS